MDPLSLANALWFSYFSLIVLLHWGSVAAAAVLRLWYTANPAGGPIAGVIESPKKRV